MIKMLLVYAGILLTAIFGLFGLLEIGSTLEAPVSVKGAWQLEITGPADAVASLDPT
jgi:hypothetical protein